MGAHQKYLNFLLNYYLYDYSQTYKPAAFYVHIHNEDDGIIHTKDTLQKNRCLSVGRQGRH